MTAADDVGPLAEEAARLMEALSGWADEHLGHSDECTVCPVCRLLGLLRQTRPETFAHLVEAAAAMTAAVRSVVPADASPDRGRRVQRIDLDR